MDLIKELYLQILNLIKNLLIAFGAETDVVDGLITDAGNAAEEK